MFNLTIFSVVQPPTSVLFVSTYGCNMMILKAPDHHRGCEVLLGDHWYEEEEDFNLNLPRTQDASNHKDCFLFSRDSYLICHCYWFRLFSANSKVPPILVPCKLSKRNMDEETTAALLNFSYHLACGNTDEAYKSVAWSRFTKGNTWKVDLKRTWHLKHWLEDEFPFGNVSWQVLCNFCWQCNQNLKMLAFKSKATPIRNSCFNELGQGKWE